MPKKTPILLFIFLLLLIVSCRKKAIPESPVTPVKSLVNKRLPKKNKRISAPKVITVNDMVAQQTPDGRLYYDLQGHRYWRNYVDGKYYLFNKSMYKNPAFKPH